VTDRERGAATVVVVAIIGVLFATTASAIMLSGVVLASHRARLAADLGALAGARRLQHAESADAACAESRRVVRANHALLTGCSVQGMTVEVTVSVAASTWPSAAVGRARAGPASTTGAPGRAGLCRCCGGKWALDCGSPCRAPSPCAAPGAAPSSVEVQAWASSGPA
jgi:secretion/DNA translocation related TadE-like protein